MKANNYQIAKRAQVLFAVALFTLALAACVMLAASGFLPKPSAPAVDVLVEASRFYVSPKPIERFVFLCLGLAAPLYALFLTRCFAGVGQSHIPGKIESKLPLIIGAVFFIPLFGSDFITTLLTGTPILLGNSNVVLFGSFFTAIAWCLWISSSVHQQSTGTLGRNAAWTVLAVTVLLQMFSWRVVSIDSVDLSWVWFMHFDAAIYALSQVIAGKTLLVDLPSQYGLFPELVAPIFKIVNPTVQNMTVLFAVMQLLSMASVFVVLGRLLKSSTVLIVSGMAMVVVTFETVVYYSGINERYFQYWPIRFFWPAVSIMAFHFFARQKTIARCLLVSIVGAIGTFWVLDTGLFVTLSFAAFLAARMLVLYSTKKTSMQPDGQWSSRTYCYALCVHVIATVAVLAVLFCLVSLKAHQWINLSGLFEYQQIFYGLGFGMLPLPRQVHPWMSVLGVYLLGIIVSLTAWRNNAGRVRADVIFYLSMLGLGLFVYYEGRSHILNLVTVCWPAILVSAIMADSTLDRIRNGASPRSEIWLPASALGFMLVCCLSFVAQVPKFLEDARHEFATRGIPVEPVVVGEISFIRKNSSGKRECLILSKRQGIYYLETGLASPFKGPGLIEMLLQSDEDRLMEQLVSGQFDCVFLGVTPGSAPNLEINMQKLAEKYEVIAYSPQRTMLYMTAKR